MQYPTFDFDMMDFQETPSLVRSVADSEGCLLKKCCKAYKKKGKRCKKCPKK